MKKVFFRILVFVIVIDMFYLYVGQTVTQSEQHHGQLALLGFRVSVAFTSPEVSLRLSTASSRRCGRQFEN